MPNVRCPWLPSIQTRPDALVNLFCFPYAGRGASIYMGWRNRIHPSVEVCPVQFPGREDRFGELPFQSLEPLLIELLQNLRPFLDKPFAFFGHSMGALVSFELARLMRGEVEFPVHLFLSGRAAPGFGPTARRRHAMDDEELLRELNSMNGTPKPLLENQELMKLMLPTIRADFAVCELTQLRAEPPLSCPITALGGVGDVEASEDDLKPWSQETADIFALQMYPGDHFFLHKCEDQILRDIASHLEPLVNRHDYSK